MKNEEQPHAMHLCRAKTRSGGACMSYAVSGKRRCRMHGGAKGSGAPRGNKNALKHGFYAKVSLLDRRLFKRMCEMLSD